MATLVEADRLHRLTAWATPRASSDDGACFPHDARGVAHARVTFADRMPADIWYGRPNTPFIYNHTEIHFQKRKYEYSPAIEGDFWYGHHYEMFRMAATFREMVKTRVEPVPHQEILEVTAMIHAGAKSRAEQSRLVKLAEVM